MRLTITALLCLSATATQAQVCEPVSPTELIGNDAIAYGYAGFSVSAAGDLAVVGVYGDDRVTIGAGSVAVYRRTDGVWAQEDDLMPDPADAARGDWMGYSVATDGQRIVVGVPYGIVDGVKTGRVLVYANDQTLGWVVEDTIAAPDGVFDDQFGTSVAIDEGVILVGAPGRDFFSLEDMGGAYVFTLDESDWVFEDILLGFSGALARGGQAVALDMPFAAFGAPRDASPGTPDTGRAWVFESSKSGWAPPTDLPASMPEPGAFYGNAVAIQGSTALVGAPFVEFTPGDAAGRVEAFGFENGSWQATQTIDARFSGDQWLGESLAIRGDTLAIGMPGISSRRGAVELHTRDSSGQWAPATPEPLAPDTLPAISFFGNSVALAEGTLLVGADRTDVPGTNAGSAWAYALCACPADLTGDGYANFFDVVEFIARYNLSDPRADLAEPFGVLNFFDIAAYIALFNAGCP